MILKIVAGGLIQRNEDETPGTGNKKGMQNLSRKLSCVGSKPGVCRS